MFPTMNCLWSSSSSGLQMIKAIIQLFVVVLGVLILNGVECRKARILESFDYSAISCRAHSASIQDFGGVGDGETLNTQAFQEAVNHLSQYASDGGAQLFVPAGKWLMEASISLAMPFHSLSPQGYDV